MKLKKLLCALLGFILIFSMLPFTVKSETTDYQWLRQSCSTKGATQGNLVCGSITFTSGYNSYSDWGNQWMWPWEADHAYSQKYYSGFDQDTNGNGVEDVFYDLDDDNDGYSDAQEYTAKTSPVDSNSKPSSSGSSSGSSGTSGGTTASTAIELNANILSYEDGDRVDTRKSITFEATRNPAWTYTWEFESIEGSSHSIKHGYKVSYSFPYSGDYSVTLTVEDKDGNTGSESIEILADRKPSASITVKGDLVVGNEIKFLSNAKDDDSVSQLSYFWEVDGDYVFDDDYEDSTLYQTFLASGRYKITLTVVDVYDEEFITSTYVIINPAPIIQTNLNADITAVYPVNEPSERGVCYLNELCVLDATGSTPQDRIINYKWSLDGNTFASGMDAEQTYRFYGVEAKQHSLTLKIVGDNSLDTVPDTAQTTLTIKARPLPIKSELPTAVIDITPDKNSYLVGENVKLDAYWSYDNDEDGESIAKYSWTVFKGQAKVEQSTKPEIETSWSTPGTYRVQLTVTDNEGKKRSAETFIIIVADEDNKDNDQEPSSPDAKILVDTSVKVGEKVHFDGSKSTGNIALYKWDFGDGGFDTDKKVDYTYDTAGIYTATLTVVDADGKSDSVTVQITVNRKTSSGKSSSYTSIENNFNALETPITGDAIKGQLSQYDDVYNGKIGKESTISVRVKNTGRIAADFEVIADATWATVKVDQVDSINAGKSGYVDIHVTPKKDGVRYLNVDLLADGELIDSVDVKFTVGGGSEFNTMYLLIILVVGMFAAIGMIAYRAFFYKPKKKDRGLETY